MKDLKFFFVLAVVLSATIFVLSCSKDTSITNNSDSLLELRSSSGCDGAPMAAPKVLADWIENGNCCFTLQFSPVYLSGTSCQIIGLDSGGNSLALKPNGVCIQSLSSSNTVICCITPLASSITISLNPGGPGATCVEIPLPCN
jgi:hypothetical protein